MKSADVDTIANEWFPIALVDSVERSSAFAFTLLDERYLLLSDDTGEATVVIDTCPHRGAQLSLGSYDGIRLQCGYHGWEFDGSGRCVHQPAHPDRSPTAASGLRVFETKSLYGMHWVSVGDHPRELPVFAAADRNGVRHVVLEPAVVESSGPRVIENFLDIAHFPFVHAGFLGDAPQTAVERYRVDSSSDALTLHDVSVWQPNSGPTATEGGVVAYDYSVTHPYAATLTKEPQADNSADSGFSILLATSPLTETSCRVFRMVVVNDPTVDLDAQRAFNRTIFLQDIPTVESQRPKRLPLDPHAEAHQPADAGSLAYRKWLVARGTRYGTTSENLPRSPATHDGD